MVVPPRIDPENPVEKQPGERLPLSNSSIMRMFWVGLGSFFLLLGALGVLLPVLPTTPFLLLTAACYARGSKRFYDWLLDNPWFGRHIRDWREHRSLPLRTKVTILIVLWATIFVTSLFFIPVTVGKIAIFAVPIGVTYLMTRIPTREWVGETVR